MFLFFPRFAFDPSSYHLLQACIIHPISVVFLTSLPRLHLFSLWIYLSFSPPEGKFLTWPSFSLTLLHSKPSLHFYCKIFWKRILVSIISLTFFSPSFNWFSSPLASLVWRRRWHLTPALLPGKSHGRRSLVGCSPWGRQESDTAERLHFHALEKEMATYPSVPAWRIPGTGEPGGLPSMGSHRVGHDWSDLAAAAAAGEENRPTEFQHSRFGSWRERRNMLEKSKRMECHGTKHKECF